MGNQNRSHLGDLTFKICIVICMIAMVVIYLMQREKIAYVDSVKLLNSYVGAIEARKQYDARVEVLNKGVDSLRSELVEILRQYESGNERTKTEQDRLKQMIEDKRQQLLSYQQAVNEKIQQEDKQLTTDVVTKVNSYIESYGKQHGYDIIFAANQYGAIVYAKEGKDLTDDILSGLNAEK